MTFAVDKVLYEQQTEHQHLVLFEHKHFGKMLMLDGATQVTTRDEFIYHEIDDPRAHSRHMARRATCSSSGAATAASPRRC